MDHKSIHRDTAMASYDMWNEPGPSGWQSVSEILPSTLPFVKIEKPGCGYRDLSFCDRDLGNQDEIFPM